MGTGHVYQGRFKSFPIQSDSHFFTLCRYVERNALRAGLVGSAEEWQWGSLWRWKHGDAAAKALLSPWPLARLPGWTEHVNEPLTPGELKAVRHFMQRGRPYGDESWTDKMIKKLGLESTLRPRGRPRNSEKGV